MKRVYTGWVPMGESTRETLCVPRILAGSLHDAARNAVFPLKRECEDWTALKAKKRRITIIVEDVE